MDHWFDPLWFLSSTDQIQKNNTFWKVTFLYENDEKSAKMAWNSRQNVPEEWRVQIRASDHEFTWIYALSLNLKLSKANVQ